MEIGTVGIIGAGLMGSGIAEECARNGIRTLVTEAGAEQLAAGQRRVGASLERGRTSGKLSDDDVARINDLLTFTAAPRRLCRVRFLRRSDCRAAPCKGLTLRAARPHRCGGRDPRHQHLGSPDHRDRARNAASGSGDRHPFFNPAPVMKLIEVVRSIATSDETLHRDTHPGRATRQAHHRRPGPRRLHRQPAVDTVSHLRDPALRIRFRDLRRHR